MNWSNIGWQFVAPVIVGVLLALVAMVPLLPSIYSLGKEVGALQVEVKLWRQQIEAQQTR